MEKSMQVIHARQVIPDIQPSLFLAGPTPRSTEVQSWRPEAIEQLRHLQWPGLVFSPEEPIGGLQPNYGSEQVHWEWDALERATLIVFWIPRNLTTLPGFTTNVEFGYYCRSGKVLLGFPDGAPKMGYLEMLAQAHNIPVHKDLSSVLQDAVSRGHSQ